MMHLKFSRFIFLTSFVLSWTVSPLPLIGLSHAIAQNLQFGSLPVNRGEIRLDGRVRSFDLKQQIFVLDVASFTLPTGKSSRLSVPKPKTVAIHKNTRVFSPDAEWKTKLSDLKAGMAVAVVGHDSGMGSQLPARQVWTPPIFENLLQMRTGFRTALVPNSFKPSGVVRPNATFKIVHYHAPVGDLVAYLSPDPGDGKKHPAVMWSHGGFGGIGRGDLQDLQAFRQAGLVVLCPSWRGENDNPGRFELFYGEVEDAVAALKYLSEIPYVDTSRLYLAGHSTGGTITLLTVESTSLLRAAFSFGGAPDLAPVVGDGKGYGNTPFDPQSPMETKLRSAINWLFYIRTPTFYFEGEESAYAPYAQRMQLLAQRQGAPFVAHIIKNGDHFNILQPITRLLAEKINADTGPQCNIKITATEVQAAFDNR